MASSINASTSPAAIVQTADGTANLSLQSNGTTIAALTSTGMAVTGTLSASGVTTFAAGTAALPAITTTGDTNTGMWFPAADTIAFSEGGAEAVRIDSSGNVGIGTSSPDRKLNVTGAAATETVIKISGSTTAGSFLQTNNTGGNFYIGKDNSAGTAFGSAYCSGLYSDGAYPIIFWTNSTERMRIDSSGNVLVGTTSLTEGERASFARSNTTTSATVIAAKNTGATTTTKNTNSIVRFASGAANADVNIHLTDVTTNDYVIGGNNGGLYCMSSTQGVRLASGGTSWASDSDERLKENLIPISNALNKVNTLRAVIGNYIDDEDKRSRAFLIAQDVQAVLPEAIDATDPEKLGLQYTDVIPLLVAAIKEQQALITSLTARITALEGA